jgi:hypothetical protein
MGSKSGREKSTPGEMLKRLFGRSFDPEKAAARLEALGWFKYVSAAALPVVRDQVTESLKRLRIPEADWLEDEALPPSTSDRRIYLADAEHLASGGLHEVLLAMRDALYAEKVELGPVVSDLREDRYDVVVNGERFGVYAPGYPARKKWDVAFVRLLAIGNELLQRAGSKTRLYGQASGNDAAVALLTPELHDGLKKLGVPARWLPRSEQEIRRTL